MNIYLDIDGVILTKEGKPANDLKLLLDYLTNNHKVFWLTTHARGDAELTANYISRTFKPDIVKYLEKVNMTDWRTNKTEAIDFSKDFFWLDDNAFESELKELIKHNSLDSYIKIDLKKNPDNLRHFLMMLIERDKKLDTIKESDILKLVKEAIEILNEHKYDRVSNYLFQRRLKVDYLTASLVVGKLFEDKIVHSPILSEDEEDNIILTVNKNKLRSLLIN